ERPTANSPAQDLVLTAQAVDFIVANGQRLERAQTTGPSQFVLRNVTANREDTAVKPAPADKDAESKGNGQTVITADHFEATFDKSGQLAAIHGSPNARIINSTTGKPDRVSTSNSLDLTLRDGKVESVLQQGEVAYNDGTAKAWGERARYTAVDQMLELQGS